MKRRYLSVIILLVLLLGAGWYSLVGSSGNPARAAPRPRPLTDAPWSVNERVNDDVGTAWQDWPSIAVDSLGNAYAVWEDTREAYSYIYFSYRPAGGTWEPNVQLSDHHGGQPSIVVDLQGNAYAVWRDLSGPLRFSYRPTGGNWGPSSTVTDDAADPGFSDIAVDSHGNAYVVWEDYRNDAGDIYLAYRPADGNWGEDGLVSDDPGTAQQELPVIAVDSFGNAYVLWQDHRNGQSDIRFAYRPYGDSWQPSVKVNDDPGTADQGEPDIAVDSLGNAYAVWGDSRNQPPAQDQTDIYYSFRPVGGTWQSNVQVADCGPLGFSPAWPGIAVDSQGNASTVWADPRSGNFDIYFSRRPAGGTWGANVRVNDDAGTANQWNPSIAVDASGNAYTAWVDDRNGNWDIYFSYRPAGGGVFTVTHLEVTQATQTTDNSVPLIAGKPTFVRVYVDCGEGCTSLLNVTGVLRGYGPSGELPGSPLTPVNGFIPAYHQDWQSQRDDLQKTLNFTLPPEWLTGTVTLTAEVNGASRSEVATFQQANGVNIIYVPIRYQGQSPDLSRIQNGSWWAFRVYPTAMINYVPGTTVEWDRCLRFDIMQCPLAWLNTRALLNELTTRYRLLNAYVYGWLPEGTYGGGTSDPTWPPVNGVGQAAFGDDHPVEGGRIFAHEIGHLMGRRHTNTRDNLNRPGDCAVNDYWWCFGDPDCRSYVDPESDWPYPTAKIEEWGLDGYGFGWLLSFSSALKDPGNAYDYMSYCGTLSDGNVWTSRWTYEHIRSETLQLQATGLLVQALSAPQPYFIASGLVYTDDTATLDPIWVVTSTVIPENPPEGTGYCMEAQDASNTPLVSRCFDLAFVNYETGEATDLDGFNLMLPYPNGVARIVLKKGTTELAIQSVSANAPVVTVLSPNGGESWSATGTYTTTWSASDADGDSLAYSVLYSPDGTNWVPVGASTTETALTVNAAELAGSSTAHIQVMASDGVNTSSDESDGVFTVGKKPPLVHILSPESNVTIPSGTPLFLQGYAYDLEDGTSEDVALSWSSDIDGFLGAGSELLVSGLSPATHTVTCTATDSDGQTGSDSVEVTVHICYSLTTNVNPTGSGSVEVSPSPNCAGGKYIEDTVVTLTAVPNATWRFDHWSGDKTGSSNPATITMDSDKSVTADFKRANLVRNGSFEQGPRIPKYWRGKNLTLKDRRVCKTAHDAPCSFKMVGTSAKKSLRQVVRASGSAGDSFTLSGWSKARRPLPKGGPYCLQAKVFHTDGTKKTYRACFAKKTHGWQRRKTTFTTAKDYNQIVVSLLYYKQSGKAWFDDIRLVAQ